MCLPVFVIEQIQFRPRESDRDCGTSYLLHVKGPVAFVYSVLFFVPHGEVIRCLVNYIWIYLDDYAAIYM